MTDDMPPETEPTKENILHFNPWRDFNDVIVPEDPFGIEPDAAQLKTFLEVVFSYCEGMIPVRGFIDKGQGRDGKPNNIWIDADATALDKLTTFAQWAWREGAAVYVIPGTVAEQGQARASEVLQMQAILVDLDAGDIGAKLSHLIAHLGRPTLIIESGGRTAAGTDKLHVWWKLSEPAAAEDLQLLCRLRGDIAVKVGGDTHFRSAHQPIRVAGSVYHKGGSQRLVQIREHNALEADLRAFAELVDAMPILVGAGAEPTASNTSKPSLQDVLITPVHEGGADQWTRFEGASAAIGHYIRLVHEGKISPNEGWECICGYNAAMLRPSWPPERLQQEADRLWALHVKKNGPALLRNAAVDERLLELAGLLPRRRLAHPPVTDQSTDERLRVAPAGTVGGKIQRLLAAEQQAVGPDDVVTVDGLAQAALSGAGAWPARQDGVGVKGTAADRRSGRPAGGRRPRPLHAGWG
mgnify:CR=1 FL=1